MTIKITLTSNAAFGKGVDFNADLEAYFDGFVPFEMPWFMEPEGSSETTQILHLDTPVTGAEAENRVVVLDGQDFYYTFANHTVSGTLETIRLATLGDAWDAQAGDLALEGGLIAGLDEFITIEGLQIVNPAGVAGDVHDIVAGLMGGGLNGTQADGQPILDQIWGQAHDAAGTGFADSYSGTRFGDTIRGLGGSDSLSGMNGHDHLLGGRGNDVLSGGNGHDNLSGGAGKDLLAGGRGNDLLLGGGGRDTLSGGAGRDILDGGAGADVLTGGAAADVFRFVTAGSARNDRITDFRSGQNDVIDLAAIDADSTQTGNQGFSFIGDAAFSAAGQLRVTIGADATYVSGDLDGDGKADFRLTLEGAITLMDSDFLL